MDGNSDINIHEENLERVNTFKCNIGREWKLGCGDDAYDTIRMENWKRVSGIMCARRISLRVKGKVYKTSNGVQCRDVGSDESTREEVGCCGNEDVTMDERSHQDGQN